MRFGFLSSYPPTQSAVANFSRALAGAVGGLPRSGYFVVRAVDAPDHHLPGAVVRQLVAGDRLSHRRAASALSRADVAVIQHDFSSFGGQDGEEVLTVLEQVRVPVIVVLNVVPSRPSIGQRTVLEAVCNHADAIVTLSRAARERLISHYQVNLRKVVVIPRGAAAGMGDQLPPVPGRILTWGLLGPGKGIEWGIKALVQLTDLDPQPQYLVAGGIDPKVAAREGEAYRDRLRQLALDCGVGHLLRFEPSYRPAETMPELIAGAAAILLPYDSDEQVTSSVLVEAVAAGRPVVATRFPHALELLAHGAGSIVPHRDPTAIAAALRPILSDPEAARVMADAAEREASKLHWPVVAQQYRQLAQRLMTTIPMPVGRLAGA